MYMTSEIIYPEESYAIIGACFNVYNQKGCGFLEPVYQECLGIELEYQGVQFDAQPCLTLSYRDRILKHTYSPDFVCYGKIVVEIKAVTVLADEHRAQVMNYLSATGYRLGLLVNFGCDSKLEHERFANTKGVNGNRGK